MKATAADLACLGRGEEGIAYVRQALQLAEEIGDHIGLERAYINLTDLLTKLGRLRESAQLGQAELEVIRRCGIYSALLVSNQIETLLAIGDWARPNGSAPPRPLSAPRRSASRLSACETR